MSHCRFCLPEGPALRTLATDLGLTDAAEFTGGVAFEEVLNRLEHSHVLSLVSEAEGWPKAITEAMAFGLVSIGSNRGLVPKMLEGGRGLIAPPGDVDALASLLADIAQNRQSYTPMRRAAAEWSQQYSLPGLQSAIRDLLLEKWDLSVPTVGAVREAAGGAN
jgi:glycosyltransferase involved in cell wall biosynthesis